MATLIKGEGLGVYTAPRAIRGCPIKSRPVSMCSHARVRHGMPQC